MYFFNKHIKNCLKSNLFLKLKTDYLDPLYEFFLNESVCYVLAISTAFVLFPSLIAASVALVVSNFPSAVKNGVLFLGIPRYMFKWQFWIIFLSNIFVALSPPLVYILFFKLGISFFLCSLMTSAFSFLYCALSVFFDMLFGLSSCLGDSVDSEFLARSAHSLTQELEARELEMGDKDLNVLHEEKSSLLLKIAVIASLVAGCSLISYLC
jgi:hypothetical protein